MTPARARLPGPAADPLFRFACAGAATVPMAALAGLAVSLFLGGLPAFRALGAGFLVSTDWNPVTGVYGAAGPIVGTLVTAFLALAMALPVALGVAVFLVEFCPPRLAPVLGIAVDLLAGIPSIVYGMWGLFVLAPWLAAHLQAPLAAHAAPGWLADALAASPTGANLLTASLILAIMVTPYMAAVFRTLFLTVPRSVREAAYGLGCTPYEVVRAVVFPSVRRGLVGAAMLGLGRALGETMAVAFVIGNVHALPRSPFDAGATLASTIANEFAEATGPLHAAALVALGFVLFCLTFAVLGIARLLLRGQDRA